jgi:hypothetical protein
MSLAMASGALAMHNAGLTTERIALDGAALVAAGVAFAATRPDPLASVAEVEGVAGPRWTMPSLLALAATGILAAIAVMPAMLTRADARTRAGRARGHYFGFASLAPIFGSFPVPLVGYGVSFAIGFMAGFTQLIGKSRTAATIKFGNRTE